MNGGTVLTSQIMATAIAPSGRVRLKEWQYVTSQHTICFYNTAGEAMAGRYLIKMTIAGQEVNSYDIVTVRAGQGFCGTLYLGVWVRANDRNPIPTKASTHVEFDGYETENEGHGVLTVK